MQLLIAVSPTTEPLVEPITGLLVASLAVSAATLVAFVVVAVATHVREPDEGPSTMDPPDRDERPALVGFLARDFEVPSEAAAATLLDLASRGWLAIDAAGGDQLVIRVPAREGKGALAPYEKRVLDHVRGLAVGRVVPAGALTTGEEDVSTKWWNGFRREVVSEARDRGLCRNRWPGFLKIVFLVGVVAAAGALWGSGRGHDLEEVDTTPLWYAALGAVVLVGALAAAVAKSRRQRDTDAGCALAGRWLGLRRFLVDHGDFPSAPATSVAIWDAYLGWAGALGLAPRAVESLPLGTEDDHSGWSSFGGTWRKVRVRYPRWRPGWGRHPLMAVLAGLFWIALAVLAVRGLVALAGWDQLDGERADRWVDLGAAVLSGVAVLVALHSLIAVGCGVADLFGRNEVTGLVVRRRTRGRTSPRAPRVIRWLADREAPEDPPRVRWFLAVDSGGSAEIAAWSVPIGTYARIRQGAVVQASVTPLLRHVRSIEISAAAPPPRVTTSADAVGPGRSDPALVDAAARLAERRFSPS